jgi:hypothetical protein
MEEDYGDDPPCGPNEPSLKQFRDFCSGLASNTSVKKVWFQHTPMLREESIDSNDGFGMAYILMSNWFEKNTVEEITMSSGSCIEGGGYDNSGENRKMAEVLARFSSLKVFHTEFENEYMGDSPCEVSEQIFDALSNHPNLENVETSHSHCKWSREGYGALARFLSGSKVKQLGLIGGMDDEGAIAVSGVLNGNDVLKEIYFDDLQDQEITSTGWEAFEELVSRSGSIMNTYHSNHTLQTLLYTSDYHSYRENWEQETLGDKLHLLLRVNTLCNKSAAARAKIIMRHFSGDFSIEPFTGTCVAALPNVIAWAGRTNPGIASLYQHADADLCLMYKFISGVAPVLFDPSPSRKRKAESQGRSVNI